MLPAGAMRWRQWTHRAGKDLEVTVVAGATSMERKGLCKGLATPCARLLMLLLVSMPSNGIWNWGAGPACDGNADVRADGISVGSVRDFALLWCPCAPEALDHCEFSDACLGVRSS